MASNLKRRLFLRLLSGLSWARRRVLNLVVWGLYPQALAKGAEAVLVLRQPGWEANPATTYLTEKPLRIEPVRVHQADPDRLQVRLESLGLRGLWLVKSRPSEASVIPD